MSVKFDAAAAETLIKEMDSYCLSMQKEAIEIFDILEFSGEWNDGQRGMFQENVTTISKDLSEAMRLESEYMRVFEERVAELRR